METISRSHTEIFSQAKVENHCNGEDIDKGLSRVQPQQLVKINLKGYCGSNKNLKVKKKKGRIKKLKQLLSNSAVSPKKG